MNTLDNYIQSNLNIVNISNVLMTKVSHFYIQAKCLVPK